MNDGYLKVLKNISSESPTPGGGAVAALSLAHSYSLTSMVANLTLKSQKWEDGHEISKLLIDTCSKGVTNSLQMAQDDCDAFDLVMSSYRLPKSNEAEIQSRKNNIINSSLEATLTPLKIVKTSFELLSLLPKLASNGNVNALTDLASASQLAFSSIYIGSLNVKVNTPSISESDAVKYVAEVDSLEKNGYILNQEIQDIIKIRLGWK